MRIAPLLVALLLGCGSSPRVALLVGIDHYADPEIKSLHGAVHDVDLMERTLRQDFDFGDVTVLRDRHATRAAILEALDDLQDRVGPESSVVFHFSGHGSQVLDTSGDEPDGWDETLVTYDSGRAGRPNRDIVDDEIGERLDKLARKAAAVTFIFDSCHSGTGARSLGGARATQPGGALKQSARPPPKPVPYTLIAAASADERAFERPLAKARVHGLLTWHLVKAMRAAPTGTWREIMARVRHDVTGSKANQHPQLEGAGRDRVLFARTTRPPRAEVNVRAAGKGQIRIAAGAAHGVNVGSVFELVGPAGRRLGEVTVSRVQAHAATARYNGPTPVGLRARLVKRALRGAPLRVNGATSTLLRELRKFGNIEAEKDPDRAHIQITSDGLIEPNGALWRVPSPAELVGRISYWAGWHAARELRHDDPTLAVDFVVEPNRPLVVGETVTLRVKNNVGKRLYLTLLSVGGDGSVSILFPDPGAEAALDPFGSWQEVRQASLPGGVRYSRDQLKLILTTEPADFRFLEQGRDQSAKLPATRWTTRERDLEISAR